jgi:hypothetical protein
MAALEAICTEGIEIERGQIQFQGSISDTIANYRDRVYRAANEKQISQSSDGEFIRSVKVVDAGGDRSHYLHIGDDAIVELSLHSPSKILDPRIRIAIDDLFGTRLLLVQTPATNSPISALHGAHAVRCVIHDLLLAPGTYSLTVSLADGRETKEEIKQSCFLQIEDAELFGEGRGFTKGICAARSSWIHASSSAAMAHENGRQDRIGEVN